MKKLIFTFTAVFFMMIAGFSVTAYGATITEKNIKEGLEFCSRYPVTLRYNEAAVPISAESMPPVIVAPDGQNGWTLIPARALFEAAGATVGWDEANQMITIQYDNTKIVLTIGSTTASVNDVSKPLDLPALIIGHEGSSYGSTMIPVRFVAENLGFTVKWDDATRTVSVNKESAPPNGNNDNNNNNNSNNTNNNSTNTNNNNAYLSGQITKANNRTAELVLVIDIGHGGKDVGSIGHKGQADQLYEKDVNFKAALALEKYLKEAGMKNVHMTRRTDVYLGLYDRPQYANDLNADLFVSVHNNSSELSTPNGTEVHYYEKVDEEGRTFEELYGISSKNVAKAIQKEMVSLLGTYDRGVKSSPKLAVLNKTMMPAVIIEGAFLSNEENLQLMRTSDYGEKYGFAAAEGMIKALNAAFPD